MGEVHGKRTDSSWSGTSEPKATHADTSSLCSQPSTGSASISSPWLQGAHLALLLHAPPTQVPLSLPLLVALKLSILFQ